MKETEFADHYNQMAAKLAAEDVKNLSRPQTAADYKLDLPADFKAPVGAQFKIDEANPLWEQGRAWAQKNGLTQEAFSEAIALVAGDRIGTEQQVATARAAEIAKLGPAGPARVTALDTFFKAYLGPAEGQMFMSRLFTAADVQMAEKIVGKITSQGGASFTNRGREPTPAGRVSDEAYARYTPAEKLAYARQFKQEFN